MKNNAQAVKRKTKLAIRVKCVKFSPDGTSFACATTEGLIMYSLQQDMVFNPIDIDENVTMDNIIIMVKEEQHMTALLVLIPMLSKTFYRWQ